MSRRACAALLAAAVFVPVAVAGDPVPVRGSKVAFAPSTEVKVNGRAVKLNLTGVGLRKRLGAGVYAVGSYVQDGTVVRTAEDVVKADGVRMLHLVMERTVEPTAFIGALRAAVSQTYPGKFEAEFNRVAKAVGDRAAAKGDHVTLLAVPGSGVRIRMADKVELTVEGADFARALWEVYLGENPVDEDLKKGLVGRLEQR